MHLVRSSFIMLDRVSTSGEQRLWRAGIHDWDAFLAAQRIPGFGLARKAFYDRQLLRAEALLQARAYERLGLPKSEHWRLYPLLKDEAVFLDIETSGSYGDVTVLGCWDGETYVAFVRGHNLDKELVREYLSRFRVVVTFNGSSFDLPVLRRYFGNVFPEDIIHVDVRHVLARLGYAGGLKSIERQLGITREAALQGVSGDDAVLLWQQYCLTQEGEFLDVLLAYNEADCRNLEPLAAFAVRTLWEAIRGSADEQIICKKEGCL
ncbi:exonuclease [Candidatus Woesearchaeota archaeon]|nr:MAG: exonuclease [Candidatus Woesearchaeota archaeon]